MLGHPRLYRRGATYYHRAAVPVDIADTYPKTEETFSLKTKDYQEAVRRVRVAATEIDRKFEAHRRTQAQLSEPPLQELSEAQIKHIGKVHYAFRLEEDEEARLEGFYDKDEPLPELPVPSFEECAEDSEWLDGLNRQNYARGKVDEFYCSEAEEVLTWDGINHRLEPQSPSWQLVARELQVATIRAKKAIRARNQGDVVETPKIAVAAPAANTPPLSVAVEDWAKEKARTRWVEKTEREHRVWMGHYQAIAGDCPAMEKAVHFD